MPETNDQYNNEKDKNYHDFNLENFIEEKKENRFEIFANNIKSSSKLIINVVAALIVLIIIIELTAFIGGTIYKSLSNNVLEDKFYRGLVEVYGDEELARSYYKDLRKTTDFIYSPYVIERPRPIKGDFINVNQESYRVNPSICPNPRYKIFIFGGSTIWGWGATDTGTIPYYLSEFLCNNQISADVINYGLPGSVSTQELINLQLKLREDNIPDIVVFYDGLNDFDATNVNNQAGLTINDKYRIADYNSHKKLNYKNIFYNTRKVLQVVFKLQELKVYDLNEQVKKETADFYLGNVKIIKSMEKEFNFKSFFYWQPSVFSKYPLSQIEQDINNSNSKFGQNYLEISDHVKKSKDVTILDTIFNNINQTVFIDLSHISEDGNKKIAEKIGYEIIKYIN